MVVFRTDVSLSIKPLSSDLPGKNHQVDSNRGGAESLKCHAPTVDSALASIYTRGKKSRLLDLHCCHCRTLKMEI
ncbi:unnamed protein product [Cuscuta campestris]|uniref:Uncharacterized protein n=1 Tax=Cuscuta campestris TaxID=132261 RepID=A0A484L4C5_9ASTE|nr:unnamed protein product [Cuscuta campestris]